ncbi:hypothetical protein [Pantoea sp. M_5]|uniref:hypothetical protein n=1 Tax=Pantoea sp. M_5 TaxID=2608038 RepID=UPI0012323D43|nr:hypothetical protein [Pantoea sp. M_5]KAA6001422.1 hypothetical protein F3I50_03500 [Pantoea sp. M_5]
MKPNTDYTKMDMLIQERIAAGKNTFMKIDGGPVYEEASRLSEETGSPAFRIIDRRLQALRKKGLIKYTTAEKWTVNYK